MVSCERTNDAFDADSYRAEMMEWRVGRVERLKAPDGFLNLIGLYWLENGSSRIGSDADNDIVVPLPAAGLIGVFEVTEEGILFTAAEGAEVNNEGQPVSVLLMNDDTTDEPVTLTHQSFAWSIIKRDERFAVRLRDYNHPALAAFAPLEYYPIEPAMRVSGKLRPFAEPKVLNVNTTIIGLGFHPTSPGTVAFSLGETTYELEAYDAGDALFFVFGDETSGRETYPAGRFLYAEAPDENGETVIDFNYAYNPPCAFNAFATCPVASPRNRLKTRIEAGEKYDPEVHKVPDQYY